jgi:hypothetical protein
VHAAGLEEAREVFAHAVSLGQGPGRDKRGTPMRVVWYAADHEHCAVGAHEAA